MVLKNRWGLLEVCVRVSEYGSPSPSPSPSSSLSPLFHLVTPLAPQGLFLTPYLQKK